MRWIILVAAMAVTGCGAEKSDALAKQQPGVSTSEIAQAHAEAEKTIEKVELPSYAPSAPVNGACADTMCETVKVAFVRRTWPEAWQGKFAAQKEVASCLGYGCQGAVVEDRIGACAWQALAISSHPDEADELDAANLKNMCGRLDDTSREIAKQRAMTLNQKINS